MFPVAIIHPPHTINLLYPSRLHIFTCSHVHMLWILLVLCDIVSNSLPLFHFVLFNFLDSATCLLCPLGSPARPPLDDSAVRRQHVREQCGVRRASGPQSRASCASARSERERKRQHVLLLNTAHTCVLHSEIRKSRCGVGRNHGEGAAMRCYSLLNNESKRIRNGQSSIQCPLHIVTYACIRPMATSSL